VCKSEFMEELSLKSIVKDKNIKKFLVEFSMSISLDDCNIS
jgi:hypothetical protein